MPNDGVKGMTNVSQVLRAGGIPNLKPFVLDVYNYILKYQLQSFAQGKVPCPVTLQSTSEDTRCDLVA